MISLAGDPVAMEIPYLFEDSGINKVGDTYIYSYCTNWNVSTEATQKYGFTNANIAYMTADHPLGPFTYQGGTVYRALPTCLWLSSLPAKARTRSVFGSSPNWGIKPMASCRATHCWKSSSHRASS